MKFEADLVDDFWSKWHRGDFKGKRVGKAFYEHFDLGELVYPPRIKDMSVVELELWIDKQELV